jgi:hypothetical protein
VHRQLDLRTALLQGLSAAKRARDTIVWPDDRYANNIVSFAYYILGTRVWDRQAEVISSPLTNTYTAVRSGRRVGKSTSIAILALHRFACFKRGQALLSSTTSDQIERILWIEVRRLHAQSGLCADCLEADPEQPRPCPHSAVLDGELGNTSKSGLKSSDPRYPRFVIGKTARKVTSAQGFGGPEFLILLDEAAGIADDLFAGFMGALASGGAVLIAGNPNFRTGFFAEAFKSERWKKIHISSRESPNYKAGKIVVPGLATREWVDQEIAENGADSAHVAIHIEGEFPEIDAGSLFSDSRLTSIVARYPHVQPKGRLHVGIDPAGEGTEGRGDYTAIAFRRGFKIFEPIYVYRGLDDEGILSTLLDLLPFYVERGEVPVINVDSEGTIGKRLRLTLKYHQEHHPGAFESWGQRAHDNAKRDPQNFARHRDDMAANFDRWVKDGGAFPPDPMLMQEVQLLGWSINQQSKAKITAKEIYHAELKRSPDRLDACILSCWQQIGTEWEAVRKAPAKLPASTSASSLPNVHRAPAGRGSISIARGRVGAIDPFRNRR